MIRSCRKMRPSACGCPTTCSSMPITTTRSELGGGHRLRKQHQTGCSTMQPRTLRMARGNADVWGEFDLVVQGMDALGAAALHSFHVTVPEQQRRPGSRLRAGRSAGDRRFTILLHHAAGCLFVMWMSAMSSHSRRLQGRWLAAADVARLRCFNRYLQRHAGQWRCGQRSRLRLTASDAAAAQAHQTFAIGVASINDAPTAGVVLTNQTATAGSLFV